MTTPCRAPARRPAGLFALLSGARLLFGLAVAQEPKAKSDATGPEPKVKAETPDPIRSGDFQIIALRHAAATDLAQLLQSLLNIGPRSTTARVVADTATNSLIVAAPGAEVGKLKELI